MKTVLIAIFTLLACVSQAQGTAAKKPEVVIVVNDSLVSMADVDKYVKAGSVKAMRKGASDDEWKALKEKFGDKAGDDKRFVMFIDLYTAEETKQRMSQPRLSKSATAVMDDGYVLKVDDKAADFTVQMLDGKTIKLSDLKGKVVLLNFWATWCGPCMMEFNEMPSKIFTPFKNKDFVFLAISRGEEQKLVAKTIEELKKKGIDFNPGLDPDKKIWDKYATISIPKNFLIDKNGVIRYVSTGYGEKKVDEMANEIKKLLRN